MSELSDLVPLPANSSINVGLGSAREDTMLRIFGNPGALGSECSPPSEAISPHLVAGVNVGPLRVSGMRLAVESLKIVFDELSRDFPLLVPEVKTAGMLCVRARRHNPAHYSNHSWGTAIDLFFGDGVVPQGRPLCHRGFLDMYRYFNRQGWYWGAGFSGDSVDSMHLEVAEETMLKWSAHLLIA